MNRRGLLRACVQAAALGVGRPVLGQAAARSLGLELEVLYAERDHLLMLRQAQSVAQRSSPPDYVVIVNEKMAAAQMIEMLSRSPAKVLVIHNDLTLEQRREIGHER